MPGGTNGSATTVLLDAPAVHEVLGRLRSMADVVLVHAAANAALEAGSVIAECDVVVVVGTFGGTSVERAQRTLSELALRGKRDIRVVMYSRRPFVARRRRVIVSPARSGRDTGYEAQPTRDTAETETAAETEPASRRRRRQRPTPQLRMRRRPPLDPIIVRRARHRRRFGKGRVPGRSALGHRPMYERHSCA